MKTIDYINPAAVIQNRLASSMKLDKYAAIMKMAATTNIAQDSEFQRCFNSFYVVRRNAEWRKLYYQIFEEQKIQKQSFGEILDSLYEKTGNIEASFTSKMVATLDSNKPIWDQFVLQNLGFQISSSNKSQKRDEVKQVYDEICDWYKGYLQTQNAKECIALFNELLPSYAWLSDTKKIDFYLWSIR